jgi:hypothetical protein
VSCQISQLTSKLTRQLSSDLQAVQSATGISLGEETDPGIAKPRPSPAKCIYCIICILSKGRVQLYYVLVSDESRYSCYM